MDVDHRVAVRRGGHAGAREARVRAAAARRGASTIALLSVASTAGIGIGYPLAGLLTDLAGIRAAYALGLIVTVSAFVAAVVVLPPAPARAGTRVDVRGTMLLTVGLLALLIVISQTELWRHHASIASLVLAGSLLTLTGWVALEARTDVHWLTCGC